MPFDGEVGAAGGGAPSMPARLWLTEHTVETHVSSILAKLNLDTGDEHHRRVLAVLAYLGTGR